MLLLGCRPAGRTTEQHDVFFGIGNSARELVPALKAFWPEAGGSLHVDAWREVTRVGQYRIAVVPRNESQPAEAASLIHLYFLNLGGYKQAQFDEFHYKLLLIAPDSATAIRQARQTAFYKHTGFTGATAHVDDKYGVDVDELYQVRDILAPELKQAYRLQITPAPLGEEDVLHLGYFKLQKL
ncbi:hypothetical protein ADICEAN_01690 [Cesiribacter andamanensis AMV16]|uniref:DUF1543 domain-containing protein n=2 Tax=Cesiribacter TaxID=1133570 RepID=M7NXL4_9BACT|nr:hypothetical protein ADICEAN_01690 [Cesiribacter andamanensis AMV16]